MLNLLEVYYSRIQEFQVTFASARQRFRRVYLLQLALHLFFVLIRKMTVQLNFIFVHTEKKSREDS